jgi:hypothetical protein
MLWQRKKKTAERVQPCQPIRPAEASLQELAKIAAADLVEVPGPEIKAVTVTPDPAGTPIRNDS